MEQGMSGSSSQKMATALEPGLSTPSSPIKANILSPSHPSLPMATIFSVEKSSRYTSLMQLTTSARGAQLYMECVQVTVTGGGSMVSLASLPLNQYN